MIIFTYLNEMFTMNPWSPTLLPTGFVVCTQVYYSCLALVKNTWAFRHLCSVCFPVLSVCLIQLHEQSLLQLPTFSYSRIC